MFKDYIIPIARTKVTNLRDFYLRAFGFTRALCLHNGPSLQPLVLSKIPLKFMTLFLAIGISTTNEINAEKIENILATTQVIDAAIEVHRTLGGLGLEALYTLICS